MLEKDIENLIAKYSQEFFPNETLTLKGQQFKIGNCYADIVFVDKFKRLIIIEIKRGILTREAAGQIIEYYGLLKEQYIGKTIELILCANIIPHERRHFLEAVGIECKELGLSLITEVAKKYKYKFLDEVNIDEKITLDSIKDARLDTVINSQSINIWIFQANPEKFDVVNALSDPNLPVKSWRVKQHKDKIKKGDIALIWVSGKEAGIYAIAEVISDPEFMAIPFESEKYWFDQDLKEKSKLRAKLKILKNLVNNPILKEQLKNISELTGLSIFRFAQATAFPVSNFEWDIIKKLR